jgi:hypothetical protein
MSDERFGIVVNSRDAWANPDELRALGAKCVRTTVDDFDQLEAVLRNHPPDVRVIATLSTRHPGIGRDLRDLAGWEATVRAFVERFDGRIWALECLSSWDTLRIEPSTTVACARRAAQIVSHAGSDISCLLASVAGSRWITRFQALAREITPADRELLGGACFQPYRKNARGFPGFDHGRFEHGEIDVAVQDAHDIVRLPIWVTEFGMRLGWAGGETGQARFLRNAFDRLAGLPGSVLAAATYHCWWDLAAAPHERGEQASGLRREDVLDDELDTLPREAWRAFAEMAGGTGTPPDVFSPGVVPSTAVATVARAGEPPTLCSEGGAAT